MQGFSCISTKGWCEEGVQMGRVEGRVTEDHVLLGVGARRFRVFAGGLIGACFLLVASLALAFSCSSQASLGGTTTSRPLLNTGVIALGASRSEERRVGKEGRSR